MALKIYKKGAYVVINNSGKLTELNSAEVSITKDTEAIDIYEVKHNGVQVLKVQLSDILDENGVAYVEAAWDIFRYEQTGSVNSSEVANPYPAPTTTVVNISSAQILTMGTTPITLLPAPGVGMYYDIDKVVFEYTHVTTPYTFSVGDSMLITAPSIGTVDVEIFSIISFDAVIVFDGRQISPNNFAYPNLSALNVPSELRMASIVDPTLGDGTLRAIITYTVRTFGA